MLAQLLLALSREGIHHHTWGIESDFEGPDTNQRGVCISLKRTPGGESFAEFVFREDGSLAAFHDLKPLH